MSATPAIWAALDTQLANTTGLPIVIFENAPTYDPPRGSEYAEVSFLPTSRRPIVTGSSPQQRYQGLYEILVAVPEHIGSGRARALVALIEERFDGSTYVTGVDVVVSIEYSVSRGGFKRGVFYCIPVSVSWYCHAE